MIANRIHIFDYLVGDNARKAFEALTPTQVRGYFETENAWVAFDYTHGFSVMEFPMRWQAWAYASSDLSFEYIWELNEKKFCEMYNNAVMYDLQKSNKTSSKKTA